MTHISNTDKPKDSGAEAAQDRLQRIEDDYRTALYGIGRLAHRAYTLDGLAEQRLLSIRREIDNQLALICGQKCAFATYHG